MFLRQKQKLQVVLFLKDKPTPYDSSELTAKETEITQMIYSLYEIKNEDEKKEFLRGE